MGKDTGKDVEECREQPERRPGQDRWQVGFASQVCAASP